MVDCRALVVLIIVLVLCMSKLALLFLLLLVLNQPAKICSGLPEIHETVTIVNLEGEAQVVYLVTVKCISVVNHYTTALCRLVVKSRWDEYVPKTTVTTHTE